MSQVRCMPTHWSVVSWWAPLGVFSIELECPHCFACGLLPGEVRKSDGALREQWNTAGLERAHLIDHARGGLDRSPNLVLLCRLCHVLMPSFGDRQEAIAWVLRGSPMMELFRVALAEWKPQ